MACMEEVLPNVARREVEDTWAKVLHCLHCADDWVAAGYGRPWARVLLCRLQQLLLLGIWGAVSRDLAQHPEQAGMCHVPTRYMLESRGWQQMHGQDQNLCNGALRAKTLLCKLVCRLSKRPAARQLMLWCLLALNLLTSMRAHVADQLRAARPQGAEDDEAHVVESQARTERQNF